MDNVKVLCWNVRGLNARARRDNVRTLVDSIRADIVCLQETKLEVVPCDLVYAMLGMHFVDYVYLPAISTKGGLLIAARSPGVSLCDVKLGCFSATVRISAAGEDWWLTGVYGPQGDLEKALFLEELEAVCDECDGPWAVIGDFNLILDPADKNNDRVNRASMRRFRRCVAELELQDLHLHGRAFTWSNERELPTLVRLDRALASLDWEERFPNAFLQALSSDASDHTPLLLQTNPGFTRKSRFHFETFWPKLDGFQEVIVRGWSCDGAVRDPYQALDAKFRNLIRELQSWSATKVGMIEQQLAAAREIILKLDRAQDFRALSAEESEFRASLKHLCLGLSSLERTMARQRARVRHIAEGDANTRYFHILARGKKKRIFIPQLKIDGVQVADHEAMEQAVFSHFQGVFGSSMHRPHGLNLGELGYERTDLSSLDVPFTEEEVWAAIRDMPSDRAPGPDGFNRAFYKAAWGTIKQDIMAALGTFYRGNGGGFSALNNGLIVLLPKRQDASSPSDYRPIAMVHSFGKLVSKILAVRLAPLLPGLMSCNQTAFVRGRALHDSYKFVQAAAVYFRKMKIPVAMLKIDISKAFDTISWSFLLDVLQALGFSRRWRDWIAVLLSTASSCVLLNGRPGQRIFHHRGVRQGDSLSPMLFILAMDAFNKLFINAGQRGILTKPGFPAVRYQCSLYADDAILFVSASLTEAARIKRLLEIFGNASGLVTNLNKCSLSTIAADEELTGSIAGVLGCKVTPFPFVYLGLPLSSKALPKICMHGLVEKVAKKLPVSHGPLMSRSGRLVWIKSVLMAMPVFAMMANSLPAWVKDDIDSICRKFLWAGSDRSVRGRCLVAWPAVTRPFDLGGLGVPDLRFSNFALQARWLWLQRTDEQRVWSGLPVKVAAEVRAFFDASVVVQIGNGRRTFFWLDRWLGGKKIAELVPVLAASIPRRTACSLTVAEGLQDRLWIRGITGGLTVTIITEYLRLWTLLEEVQLQGDAEDRVIWKWSADGKYSTSSAYKALHLGSVALPGSELIWRSWLPLRVKIFLWLAFRRRHWTADRRRRHGLDARELCWLCEGEPETCDHLLFRCRFARMSCGSWAALQGSEQLEPNGRCVRFWEDKWNGRKAFMDLFRNLYRIVRKKHVTVASVLNSVPLNISFRRILVGDNLVSWYELVSKVANISLAIGNDKFMWDLNKGGAYSVIYRATYWIRCLSALYKEEEREKLKVGCRHLESVVLKLFFNFGWQRSYKIEA
ncbi:hypothetical protein U9M48_025357 [Paspalum notatum var. saurae]|uniref:Reverse transcriptase domain-containing protein n=1 Tax=Paspalum notatum var. saurae TaxID=547442 RepID=A0AAQ3TPA7_PASNO